MKNGQIDTLGFFITTSPQHPWSIISVALKNLIILLEVYFSSGLNFYHFTNLTVLDII